jgi:hypothetical protein
MPVTCIPRSTKKRATGSLPPQPRSSTQPPRTRSLANASISDKEAGMVEPTIPTRLLAYNRSGVRDPAGRSSAMRMHRTTAHGRCAQ